MINEYEFLDTNKKDIFEEELSFFLEKQNDGSGFFSILGLSNMNEIEDPIMQNEEQLEYFWPKDFIDQWDSFLKCKDLLNDMSESNSSFTYSEDNSFLSNKKRRRSPSSFIIENDLTRYNYTETKKLNKSDELFNKTKKKNIFNVKKKNNLGRNPKDSEEKGKHDKYYFDNISRGIKSLSFDCIRERLNFLLAKIEPSKLIKFNIKGNFLRFNAEQANRTKKDYNSNLMQKTIKEIFSEKISGKYNKEEYYNKILIDKIYRLNESEKDENSERLINLMELKYVDFWVILSLYHKLKDKPNYLDTIDDNYSFIKDLINNFNSKVEKHLKKNNSSEQYKIIFKLVIEDFHKRFD